MSPASRLLFVLAVVASVAYSLTVHRDLGPAGYAVGAVVGILFGTGFWLVAGLLVWAGRRVFGRRGRFAGALRSPIALGAVFVIMGSLFVDAGGPPDRDDMPRVVTDHMELATGCIWQSRQGKELSGAFTDALSRGDWPAAVAAARRAEANAQAMHSCLQRLPSTKDPELDRLTQATTDAAGQMAQSWSSYTSAAERQDIPGLLETDGQSVLAQRAWLDAFAKLGKVVDRWAPGKRFRPAALR